MSLAKKIVVAGLSLSMFLMGTVMGVRAEECGDAKPMGTPDLFQINRVGSKATLYWTPIRENTTGYFISYGLNGDEHAVYVDFNARDGVNSFVINDLNPAQNYKFSMRAHNGCMPGDWGNTMRTGGTVATQVQAEPVAPAPVVATEPTAHDDRTLGVTNVNTGQTIFYRYY